MKHCFVTAAMVFLFALLTASHSFAAAPDRLLQEGARGDDVKAVQKLLADQGYYPGTLDGVFGVGTTRAVKAFQEFAGLASDGSVGKETFAHLSRGAGEPSRFSREMTMTASAYTSQDAGNGARTCRGNLVRKGLAAVDPAVIPLGTRLYIPGYGYAIADDIGGSIKGARIDLAFENRAEALQFGLRKVTVFVFD